MLSQTTIRDAEKGRIGHRPPVGANTRSLMAVAMAAATILLPSAEK
jgi:hypothetical protein